MASSGKKVMQWEGLTFLTESVCFPPTVVMSVKGLYLSCAGQLNSLEEGTVVVLLNFANAPKHP